MVAIHLPFEYERRVRVKGKDVWRKHTVFGTLEEMRQYWVTHPKLPPDDPFKKMMIEAIDLAIAGKIPDKPGEIFRTALKKYEAVYGKQNLTVSRKKDEE